MVYPSQFRKPHRLKQYDYSSVNSYMLTFNTLPGSPALSEIIKSGEFAPPAVNLLPNGIITEKYILNIPRVYPGITLDNYVIMPDHVHILLTIEIDGSEKHSVAKIIQKTKTMITREIGLSVWQLDFYDVIADSEKIFMNCDQYIDNNPSVWLDKHGEPIAPK